MDDVYDIAVIGGGINGCGIARDAAGRGAKVLLLEKGDLAQGTSSASTKLIHGGLRYLEHHEFALVRESLREREVLWAIAPHIIWPLRFVLPWQKGLRPKWLLRLGLFLYDHIGGRKLLLPTRTIDLRRHVAGEPLKPGFGVAFEYSDAWVDDARLVVLNALDARERGADVRTRCAVTGLARDGQVWRISASPPHRRGPPEGLNDAARDTRLCGNDGLFRARIVINATGPGVAKLLGETGQSNAKPIRLVRGSHIVVPRKYTHDRAYFFQNPDGRIFFAIPYEDDFTLIGTTDADHKGTLENITISQAEIDYLCAGASAYFSESVSPDQIVWSYAGVRPLVDDGKGRPEAASRGYSFVVDSVDGAAPILSVFGGKITTFRHLAEAALDELVQFLPVLEQRRGWTANAPLPGGDFPTDGAADLKAQMLHDYPFLPAPVARRLVRSYGRAAWKWLGKAQSWNELGQDFGNGLTSAEVDYLTTQEWAASADDILWRRSKLGLRLDKQGVSRLQQYMARTAT